MKNPERIFPFIFKVADIWTANPELKFIDIINLIESKVREAGEDLHDISDYDLEAILKEMADEPVVQKPLDYDEDGVEYDEDETENC